MRVRVDLDGTGEAQISTGVGFLPHAHRARTPPLIDIEVEATGDLHIDAHHRRGRRDRLLGENARGISGTKKGIARFGDATVPLDEALVQAVDVAGRPYCMHTGEPGASDLCRHQGIVTSAR